MKVIHVLRKPLSESTVASNTLKHGVGGLNIDASRISTDDNLNGGAYAINPTHRAGQDMWTRDRKGDTNSFKRGGAGRSPLPGDSREGAAAGMFQPGSTSTSNFVPPSGRWPGNLILQHLDGCRCEGTKRVKGIAGGSHSGQKHTHEKVGGFGHHRHDITRHNDPQGNESVANWICVEGCPVKTLDEQSGDRPSTGNHPSSATKGSIFRPNQGAYQKQGPLYSDRGGASRFFKQVGGKGE